MVLITRQSLANIAAARWRETYEFRMGPHNPWARTHYGPPKETYDKLVALGVSPHPDDVDKVIGNDTWTSASCDVCLEVDHNATPSDVVEIEYGYGERTFRVCRTHALEIFNMFVRDEFAQMGDY